MVEVVFWSNRKGKTMKRMLTIALSVVLLLVALMMVASAEVMIVNDVTSITGWEGVEENTELCAGKTVLSHTYTKPLYATWGYPEGKEKDDFDQIVVSHVFTEPMDISSMNYLSMEIYASNKDIFTHRFIVELTSSGQRDKEENSYAGTLDKYATDMGNNWYLLEIPIVDLKTVPKNDTGLNKTACNFMRFYYDDGFGTAFEVGDGFTIGIRKLGFSAEKETGAEDAEAVNAINALYEPLASIKKGDINAENYETVKAQLAAAKEAYKNAKENVQEKVRETYSVLSIASTVDAALREYEDSLNTEAPVTTSAPAPESTPDSNQAGKTDKSAGCSSSVSGLLLPLILIALPGFLFARRKKDGAGEA